MLRYINSPLKNVPGPWWSRFTRLPLKLQIIQGRRIYYIDELHAKYGPFVRVAPNEIAVSDVETFSQIHRVGSDYLKTDWYHTLTAQDDGKYSLLTLTDPKEYGRRRRMFSRPLSKNFLHEHWHDTVREKTRLAIGRMKKSAQANGGTVDVFKWFILMAMDIAGRLMYGQSFNNLENGKVGPASALAVEMVRGGIR